mgnify:FL=1
MAESALGDEQAVDPSVVDLDILRSWMDDGGLGHGELTDVTALAGGTQNLLLRFVRDGRTYVLRRPPEHKRKNSDETMRREARVLAALAGSDVPHPSMIAAEADESVLGAAFYLMEAVDGFVAPSGLPDLHASSPEIRHGMGLAFADAAAALGAVDHEAVGLGDFGRPDGYLERQVPRWRSQLESYADLGGAWTLDIPHVDATADWLEANRPADFDPGIIHGDYHLGNVMYRTDGPELAAVVDWELATIGDPLLDVGMIMAFWPGDDGEQAGVMSVTPWDGFPTLTEMIDRYRERSTRSMDSIAWYGVLACYKTGIILEGTHARAGAGKAPASIGDLLHATTVRLFERGAEIIRRG